MGEDGEMRGVAVAALRSVMKRSMPDWSVFQLVIRRYCGIRENRKRANLDRRQRWLGGVGGVEEVRT